jgi:hypothetical protein
MAGPFCAERHHGSVHVIDIPLKQRDTTLPTE